MARNSVSAYECTELQARAIYRADMEAPLPCSITSALIERVSRSSAHGVRMRSNPRFPRYHPSTHPMPTKHARNRTAASALQSPLPTRTAPRLDAANASKGLAPSPTWRALTGDEPVAPPHSRPPSVQHGSMTARRPSLTRASLRHRGPHHH